MVEYCKNCDSRLYNLYLNGAVLHLSHVLLHDKSIADWRFQFELCLGWLKKIFPRYAVMGKVAEAHMALGLAQGTVTSAEARSFRDELQRLGRHHDLAKIGVTCIVDFTAAMSSDDNVRAQDLAQKFDELVLFDELTTGIL
jgi:hypothetical protein